ncbi:hypothetical protein EZV62_026946 [Acer yangbiense]|uniref:DUF1685 domain-containing protein n=1 Tax=Acer yangbiense TaxID=1000413 RepID=A0A5C7GTK3_9ROSI|nr:hypothetical protein EZV62_026946 [Acer yangbiense]
MDFENVIKIFDSCWFEMEILKSQPRSSSLSVFEANPDQENEEKQSKPEISRIPSRHKRSMSADLTSFDSVLSLSPDSVLFAPKLETILSGKESIIEGKEEEQEEPKPAHDFQDHVSKKKAAARTRRRKRNTFGGGESKSLSDLEFEELKGFMDLGFVFTEEDNKDSRLVEIVPGLQRLKGRDQISDNHINDNHESANNIPRPYLSEAWDVLDMKKEEEEEKSPLLIKNWKIPALSNEIDMKDHLKWWAHTVASTVR